MSLFLSKIKGAASTIHPHSYFFRYPFDFWVQFRQAVFFDQSFKRSKKLHSIWYNERVKKANLGVIFEYP